MTQLLGAAPELHAYERWLSSHHRSGPRDYLFSDERPRFEPRQEDVVVALPGLAVSGRRLMCKAPAVDIELDIARRDAERILGAIDGKRCLLEVRWHSGVEQETLARFLRATFGRVVLAPRAIEALESDLPGVEIVRVPGSPYSIERPYWTNMIAVRRRFMEHSSLDLDELRELHVIALMGPTLESFYKPASPVADEIVAPGALYLSAPRTMETASGTIYLDGPRVKVPLLGGEGYQRALCRSLGDEEALGDARTFEEDGLAWGRLVTARSERDEGAAPFFLPPRPMRREHFAALIGALAEAQSAKDAVPALARFHQRFVRLHPFHCANQSLAMNLVNAVLSRARGAGIPHLVLDHLALRMSTEAYAEAFRRAVDAYAIVEPDPVKRLALLLERKRRSFAVISSGLPTDDEDGARWALLSSAQVS